MKLFKLMYLAGSSVGCCPQKEPTIELPIEPTTAEEPGEIFHVILSLYILIGMNNEIFRATKNHLQRS